MNPILLFLGLLDTLSGTFIVYPNLLPGAIGFMAAYSLLKGGFSWIISIGAGYYTDWMGTVDIIAGLTLLLMFFQISFSFFFILGIVAALKGLYCFVSSLAG